VVKLASKSARSKLHSLTQADQERELGALRAEEEAALAAAAGRAAAAAEAEAREAQRLMQESAELRE
jgi:hypothetical protein